MDLDFKKKKKKKNPQKEVNKNKSKLGGKKESKGIMVINPLDLNLGT